MKAERQAKIIQLVENYDIETQEELANKLNDEGLNVTQATVSRDIRELKLTKIGRDDGKLIYSVIKNFEKKINDKLLRVLVDGFISMDRAQNIIVIRTLPGMAMAVGAALDSLDFNEILGCIAGDDTVFCAIRTEVEAVELMPKLGVLVLKN